MVSRKALFGLMGFGALVACGPIEQTGAEVLTADDEGSVSASAKDGAGESDAEPGHPIELIKANVALFDELKVCAANPSFKDFGVAPTGPCGDWLARVAAQKEKDRELIMSGLECLAGDIELAGLSMIRPDDKSNQEHIAWVEASVEDCRKAAH